ncbi:CPP1-like family protein [Alkalinema sp. FACHB-956]|uniref:CPP1-like family protein n=1 Tax=Alkalinema sp. FACHB-956 TaxID=2692768 RepID=UPI001685950D|nr:CPP1-like family protein [Alkalinema sp. FACHB-956]MBD2326868.1 CPP1-like family protein [Alkalinema sp. FACHB-956]
MSEQSPYEKLGVSEGATFEEIQATRTRLLEEYADEPQKVAQVEAAYDAVLMQRLKLRQEGKIAVPDGIRFAEQASPSVQQKTASVVKESGQWFQSLLGQTDRWSWALPAIVYLALGTWVGLMPQPQGVQLAMMVATGSALYFLYRKEKRIGRSALWGFGGLIGGFVLGTVAYTLLKAVIPGLPSDTIVISWTTFLVLWGIASFLK